MRRAVAGATFAMAGLLGTGSASAAPSPAQHPYTFKITCQQLGPVAVSEGASVVGFIEGDTVPAFLVVSAFGAVYEGALTVEPVGQEPVFSFARTWGSRGGLPRDTCERVATEVDENGVASTAFEHFVIALLPH